MFLIHYYENFLLDIPTSISTRTRLFFTLTLHVPFLNRGYSLKKKSLPGGVFNQKRLVYWSERSPVFSLRKLSQQVTQCCVIGDSLILQFSLCLLCIPLPSKFFIVDGTSTYKHNQFNFEII